MNAEIFAEWLQHQGYRVYRTRSSYWYNAGPRVLQAFPYHWLITPDLNELRALMLRHGIAALRYSSPINTSAGKVSYHIVQNQPYNISTINTKARNGIKKGLDCFKIEKISFKRLAEEGWYLQEDTLLRQNRQGSMDKKEWERLCTAAQDLPGFEVFAAVSDGELAAAAIVCRMDDTFNVPYAMSHSRFLRNHVNNALFFTLSCDLLGRENTSGIFFTVQSLDAPANVDEFKLRMGFEKKAVRQNVVFHPYLKPLIRPVLQSLTMNMHRRYPSYSFLPKLEGMIRFYLEGQLPVREQTLPDCLKEDISLLDSIL